MKSWKEIFYGEPKTWFNTERFARIADEEFVESLLEREYEGRSSLLSTLLGTDLAFIERYKKRDMVSRNEIALASRLLYLMDKYPEVRAELLAYEHVETGKSVEYESEDQQPITKVGSFVT